MTDKHAPEGDLVIRTVAMPNDTNFNGDIFGGWLSYLQNSKNMVN